MKHVHVSNDELLFYLEQELPPRDRQAVAAHLDGCENCSDRLAKLKQTLGDVGRLDPVYENWSCPNLKDMLSQ